MKVKELRMCLVTKDKITYRSRRNGKIIPQKTIEDRMKLGNFEVYQISATDKNELDILLWED